MQVNFYNCKAGLIDLDIIETFMDDVLFPPWLHILLEEQDQTANQRVPTSIEIKKEKPAQGKSGMFVEQGTQQLQLWP